MTERAHQGLIRGRQVAHVRERVAEGGGEADVEGVVDDLAAFDLLQAAVEDERRPARLSGKQVTAPERGVEVGPLGDRDRPVGQDVLEGGDRLGVPALAGVSEAEPDLRLLGDRRRGSSLRLGGQVAEALERGRRVADAELELGLGEPGLELAGLDSRLQVLGADPEVRRDHAQRLHRRHSLSGLDTRHVGDGDSRAGDRALAQTALVAESANARADGLCYWLDPSHRSRSCTARRRSSIPHFVSCREDLRCVSVKCQLEEVRHALSRSRSSARSAVCGRLRRDAGRRPVGRQMGRWGGGKPRASASPFCQRTTKTPFMPIAAWPSTEHR